MERILLKLGPFTVYTFGVSIAIGVLVGLWLANREANRLGLNPDQILELAFGLLVGGILGARLFFILAYDLSYYLANPLDVIKIYEGGLSIHGGIIGAVLVGLWYTRRMKLDFWRFADALVPSVILAQGIARIGCDVFGIPMQVLWPWGVYFNGQIVHPVQIYETLLDLVLFIFVWGLRYRKTYQGQLFVYYLGGYALIRFVLEFFRTNPSWFGSITPAHLTSAAFIIVAAIVGRHQSRNQILEVFTPLPPRFWVSGTTWLSIITLAIIGVGIFFNFSL